MPHDELLSYLRHRADHHLRGVVHYNGDETDILYLRDDIRRERMMSEIDRMLRRLRPDSEPSEERAFPFGDLYATVRRFEEPVILHFPQGDDRGLVVALEPDLNSFIEECRRRV